LDCIESVALTASAPPSRAPSPLPSPVSARKKALLQVRLSMRPVQRETAQASLLVQVPSQAQQ